jgi:PIN domain nuclease of toxin-antitoxin system
VSRRRGRAGPPPFLLDTHVWLWFLAGSDRLPAGLRAAIEEAQGELWLSPISVWELGMLAERRRVRLAGGLRPWVDEALRALPVEEAALNREVALVSHEVDLAHRDPADRFLAATALVYGLTVATVDERLRGAGWLPTRSA